MKRIFVFIALLLLAVLVTSPASAQNWPEKPIKLVIPLPPGSPNDVIARFLAQRLPASLGQPVVVEHRPGAGTTIGSKSVASAEPDGYTLLFAASNHAITAALYKNLDYDPIKSFTPVASLASSSWIFVIAPNIPVMSVAELVAWTKANPGKFNFGFGLGTAPQMVGESFRFMTGADITSIPYKGGAQAITDILGGVIQMNVGTPATLLPQIKQGKLKPIAVTSDERHPELPDVPTMIESGLPKLALTYWAGVLAPAGTPAAIVTKLNGAINAALQDAELQDNLRKFDFVVKPATPQAFESFLASEMVKWAEIVRTSGAKIN